MLTTRVSSTRLVENLQAWCPTTTTQCDLTSMCKLCKETSPPLLWSMHFSCSDWLVFGQTHRCCCLKIPSFCSWDGYGRNLWLWAALWILFGPILKQLQVSKSHVTSVSQPFFHCLHHSLRLRPQSALKRSFHGGMLRSLRSFHTIIFRESTSICLPLHRTHK